MYVTRVFPLLKAANQLIESICPPSTYEEKEEIADRKITSEELTQLRKAFSNFSSALHRSLKTNLISFVFSKLQRYVDQETFLIILAWIKATGDYELVQLHADCLILASSDFSGGRKADYLECAFEKLRTIPFDKHYESNSLLWDRLIVKVVGEESKEPYTLDDFKPLRNEVIKDVYILADSFDYKKFFSRCVEYLKNLEVEESKKEEKKTHSEFFPSLQCLN
ncbi:hypothetical protein [Coxiella burnetii]|uniref:hypothetical protein n=1 Tax=Coxiella burnetii TaxID=777 RepID=UPI0000DADDC0|nr:hypothetical protein [Coxiella burnetii]